MNEEVRILERKERKIKKKKFKKMVVLLK